jgi:hypothetical protein
MTRGAALTQRAGLNRRVLNALGEAQRAESMADAATPAASELALPVLEIVRSSIAAAVGLLEAAVTLTEPDRDLRGTR